VECPLCGNTAMRFIRNRCPTCGSGARQRLIAVFLSRELHLETQPCRLLHFAPEPGLAHFLSTTATVDYVPADLTPDHGHERVDATSIHLAPTFDGVIASHVLEHIPDDAKAISEIYRVLRPGGWALVIVPVADDLHTTYESPTVRSAWTRHIHYGQHDHVRVYGRDIAARLSRPGFSVQARRYATDISSAEIDKFGLWAGDTIFVCRKPG